ncbi:MAG: hypothetical protein HYZ72_15180 [Deltaproteobacteria bacterium]|nr:hypothetical protein [Deltaproteobacteria bacterium]
MAQRFASALRTLGKLFQDASADLAIQIRFALIGGLAVSAWGRVRATQDIDVLADSDPSPIQDRALRVRLTAFWEARGCAVEWRAGTVDDPIALLLRLGLPRRVRMTADILWAQKQWQREALKRACSVRVSRATVFVLHPEDLILMKLEAGGPQDLLDVEGILSTKPPELDRERLTQAAARLRLKTLLDKCMRRAGQ